MRSSDYQEKLVIGTAHASMRMQFSLDPYPRGGARSGARTGLFSQVFLVWSVINVYKYPLDNFHLQDPSTIIQSSEMPTKS